MKKKFIKRASQGTIEFLIVFVLLFVLFIGIVDIALFFRQMYLVQTLSDEALAKLQTAGECSKNLENTAQILATTVDYFYNTSPTFSYEYLDGIYQFNGAKYSFILSCRNETVPDSLEFRYKYSGLLFLRKSHEISSDFSSNTLYF